MCFKKNIKKSVQIKLKLEENPPKKHPQAKQTNKNPKKFNFFSKKNPKKDRKKDKIDYQK